MNTTNGISKNAPVDEREARRRRREARVAAAQALSSPNVTEIQETAKRDTVIISDVVEVNGHGVRSNKTQPAGFQPDSHHSVPLHLHGHSPALDGELTSGPLQHPERTTNATSFTRKRNERIDFPPPNDPKWKEIDLELAAALPRWFSAAVIAKTPIEKLGPKFDNQIYQFFVDRFGTKKQTGKRATDRPKRENRRLIFFRRRKRECQRARRALIKAGVSRDSPEFKDITKHWFTLVHQHNKLRKHLAMKDAARAKKRACNAFRKDPYKFARELFQGPRNSNKPTFSKEDAQEYFSKTYRDEERNFNYEALNEQPTPPKPEFQFQIRCPTLKELARHLRRKRNNAAPGFNSLTYVPYKKCPSLLYFVHKIGCKIWKEGVVPSDWGEAFIVLLSKSEVLSEVSEFRPIALTSTVGKIFFSCVSDRIQHFMTKNSYINREKQKGFLSGLAGCLEHSFALHEAIREAKEHTRQLVITWIDLANAYGSVRHNLIQFALNWYHVPKKVQKLIFNYYEHLRATVEANDWSTGFFLFDIGLFQGCVLSTILFDCVFQLLLDFLKPISKLGYTYKLAKFNSQHITKLDMAYADDLALLTRTPDGNQKACDRVVEWLDWTVSMKAKPRKCVSMGMRQFDRRIKCHTLDPAKGYEGLTYAPFDPKLTIAGKAIRFIYDPDNDDEFKGSHFKFLGRHIHFFGKEDDVKKHIRKNFRRDLAKINELNISGFIKAWLYEYFALRRQSWAFLVHDLDRSFAIQLNDEATGLLKNWIGIYKTAETGILFRSKTNFGLGLTSVLSHFECMQMVKSQLLFFSVCGDISALYQARERREEPAGRKWRFTRAHTHVQQEADHRVRFQPQSDRQGLGRGHFKAVIGKADRRKIVASIVRGIQQEERLVHSVELARQGAWTRWADSTIPYDFSWRNLIWGLQDQVIKFVIHTSINWIKTPDLMALWGKGISPVCPLCGHKVCSILHILSACKFALNDKRYEWRHDSVLLAMSEGIRSHIDHHNSANIKAKIPHISSSFVRAGKKATAGNRPQTSIKSLLVGASDWKLLTDYQHAHLVFPPEIIATNLRPDMVIWSPSVKTVILLELTCPAEEGIAAASSRKLARYSELVEQIGTAGWKAVHFPFEVGARGFIAKSTFRCLSALGLSPTSKKALVKALSSTAARCSYAIYLARDNIVWDRNMSLLGGHAVSTAC